MEPLVGFWSYFWMFAAAIISGAIGGFVFELMPVHSECHMGLIKIPNRPKKGDKNSFDLGFLSNLLLGAVTSVAVLYFFPPATQTIMKDSSGINQTMYSYDLVKLIALSLIVGSAGPGFLSSIQSRFAGALSEQRKADATTAQDGIDKLREAYQAALEEHHNDAKRQVTTTVKEIVNIAPMTVSTNGHHNGAVALESHKTPEDVDKIVDSAVNKLHDICDRTVDGIKQELQAQAETAKREIRQEMGSD